MRPVTALFSVLLTATSLWSGTVTAFDKDCRDPNNQTESLKNGFCTVPADGFVVQGVGQRVGDPLYSIDCVSDFGSAFATGSNRTINTDDTLECDGVPSAATGGGVNYSVNERFTVLKQTSTPMFVDRAKIQGLTDTVGQVQVGTVFDYVLRDETDGRLVLAFRTVLTPSLPDNGDLIANPFEVNFFYRRGNTGFDLGANSSLSTKNANGKGSLRLYNVSKNTQGALSSPVAFSDDWVRFQTDINVTEQNPTHNFFYLKTSAACTTYQPDAIRVRQAGEESQPIFDFKIPGFVSSAQCSETAEIEAGVVSTVSFPFEPDPAHVTTVTTLPACTDTTAAGFGVTELGACLEVSSDQRVGLQPAVDPLDAATWPNVCVAYDQPALDAAGIDEAALTGKKCEEPGGSCCIVGGTGAGACKTSCEGGTCTWDVVQKSASSLSLSAAAALGSGISAQWCFATPTFSEFSLVQAAELPQPAAAQVPVPFWALMTAGAGLAFAGAARLRRQRSA